MASENTTMADVNSGEDLVGFVYEASYAMDDNPGKRPELYRKVLEVCAGTNNNAKRLCADVIKKHFRHYPDMQSNSLDAIVDLLEGDYAQVRNQALSVLPVVAKEVPAYHEKICEMLIQLLATESTEQQGVCKALKTMVLMSPEMALKGIFLHFAGPEALTTREKAIGFVTKQLVAKGDSTLIGNLAVEKALFHEVEKAISSLPSSQVSALVGALGHLQLFHEPRRRQLAELAIAPLKSAPVFDPADVSSVEGYIACVKLARDYAKTGPIPVLASYTFDKVLPVFAQVQGDLLEGLSTAVADVADRGAPDNVGLLLPGFLVSLLDNLPSPPEGDGPAEDTINYALMEALLLIFHQLISKEPKHFAEGEGNRKLAQPKLLYLGTRARTKSAQLDKALSNEKSAEKVTELQRAKLRTSNVVELIKDLLRPKLTGKAIKPSWLQPAAVSTAPSGAQPTEKRLGQGGDKGSGKKRAATGLYKPPQGKYSGGLGDDKRAASASAGNGHDDRATVRR